MVRHAFTDDVSEDHHCLRCRQPKIFLPPTQVHYALTDDASHSYHLTIGLHRDNRQWRDVLRHMLDDDPDETDETRKLHAEMMEIYASSIEGLHLHEAVPGWLLTCRLPWARSASASLAAGTRLAQTQWRAPHTLRPSTLPLSLVVTLTQARLTATVRQGGRGARRSSASSRASSSFTWAGLATGSSDTRRGVGLA